MSIRNAVAAVLLVTASGTMIASAANATPTSHTKAAKAPKLTKAEKKAAKDSAATTK
jgi:hypothetical protein